jgi:hypothetical protein
MRVVWFASLALAVAAPAFAQTTIYKLIDESGRVTYSNKPMKGATVMDLEPITIIQSTNGAATPAAATPAPKAAAPAEKLEVVKLEPKPDSRPETKSALAIAAPTLASVEPQVQKRRDGDRRKILEQELQKEEQSLAEVRQSVFQEQQNPMLIAAVRTAQQAVDPTPSQLMEYRSNIDKVSGRIRGLQATVAEHEKNIEALKKELGALKP